MTLGSQTENDMVNTRGMPCRGSTGRYQHGVTLMELMIVVAIVGILAGVAFPAYKAYVDRAKRSEGKAFLMEIAARQERYYFDNNSYAADPEDLGYGNATAKSDEGHYTLDDPIAVGATGAITTSYVLKIKTVSPWKDDTCGNFLTLDSKGAQDSDTHNVICWSK